MDFENISLKRENNIGVLTIKRPQQLNALNKQTIREIHLCLMDLRNAEDVRVVIITGSGEKAFIAGADIKEFSDYGINEGTELAAQGQELLFNLLQNFSKPVIAAINGFALGGGLELAMACHIRVASYNAKMGLPETSLGLIPGYGGTQRLARLVGHGRALEMITTAEMIKADRAYEIGLVNHAVAATDLMSTCIGIAEKIIKNSPKAITSAIRAVNAGYTPQVDGYQVEIEEFGRCFGTNDFKEGTTAFLEKRKPNF